MVDPPRFLSLHEPTAAAVVGLHGATGLPPPFGRKWKSFAISYRQQRHFAPTRHHLRDEIYISVAIANFEEWQELNARLRRRDSAV